MRAILVIVVSLAALFYGFLSARAQGSPLTVDVCKSFVEQYGIPEQDSVLTFQGGSQEAAQVAFCQSLAFTAAREGSDLGQVFANIADSNDDGTVDATEMATYFTAARSGNLPSVSAPASVTTQPSTQTTPLPTALPSSNATPGSGGPAILPGLAVLVVVAAALLLIRARRNPRAQL